MLILQKPKICLVEIPNTDISDATEYMEKNPLLSLQEEPYVPRNRNSIFRVRSTFVEKYLYPELFLMEELSKQTVVSRTDAVLLKLELGLMQLARAELNHVQVFCPKEYFLQRIKETTNKNFKAHYFACIAFSDSSPKKGHGLLFLNFIESTQTLFMTGHEEWFSPTNTFFLTGRIFMRKWIQSEWNNLRGLKHIMSHTYENDYFYKDYKPVSHKIHFLFAHEERRLCFSRILSLSSQSVLKHLYERTYSEHHYWKKALVITEMERRMK